MTRIDLVLTDDWELRGDGSGHMPTLQFDAMNRLMTIDERHGLRATFTVEVLQQLRHLEEGARHPALIIRQMDVRIVSLGRIAQDLAAGFYPVRARAA